MMISIKSLQRVALSTVTLFLVVGLAWFSARLKMHDYSTLSPLKVGMHVSELSFLGEPTSTSDIEQTYVLPDQSTLVVAIDAGQVYGAWLELKTPLKVQDPSLRHLTFVQMGVDEAQAPTWFYAAAPGEGRIFKVSDQGFIQSITWVKPFTPHGPSHNLQALLQDFTVQRSARL